MIGVKTDNLRGVQVTQVDRYDDSRGRMNLLTQPQLMGVRYTVSRAGAVRGIHGNDETGPIKYVTCVQGLARDVVVDLRPGSATFGHYVVNELTGDNRTQLVIAPGLGHAIEALEDNTIILYGMNRAVNYADEWCVNPLDPSLRLPWLTTAPIMSDRDKNAPVIGAQL